MFDIGWPELAIAALIALLVIGPKDLPAALQTLGKWVRYARGIGRELRQGVDELAREAELDDLRKNLNSMTGGGSPRNILNEKVLDSVDSDRGLRDALGDADIRDQVSALRRDVENAGRIDGDGSGEEDPAETDAAPASGDTPKRDA